jgi:hypothetical protein
VGMDLEGEHSTLNTKISMLRGKLAGMTNIRGQHCLHM